MAELAAIVAGIGAYPPGAETYGAAPLRYAAADAQAVVDYLKTCWPDPQTAIVHHIDEAGLTRTALATAFADLVERGPHDLLIVYLSGHGLAGDRPGFLVQPETGGPAPDLIPAEMLSGLIDGVTADRILFILDCCFAEALVRRMPVFLNLGAARARLFITSSRADQRTWEDDTARHSVFTAHLIDLLNTGSAAQLPGTRDQVNVDGELFPFLCQQVPLYVLTHKDGQHQEPVKGGTALESFTLPVGRSARRLREQTPLVAALRRVRQITIGAAATITTGLVLAYGLLWHPEIDAKGEVVLRNGPRWMEPALTYLPGTRLATGIHLQDLSLDPAARQPVQSGALIGVWSHLSRQGYRRWYDDLRPSLSDAAAYDLDALAGARRGPLQTGDKALSSAGVAQAAVGLLSTPDPAVTQAIVRAIPGSDRLSPMVEPFNRNKLDFSILDLPASQMINYAIALRYLAMTEPDRAQLAYLGYLKATQEWLEHNSDAQRGLGALQSVSQAVIAVLPVIDRVRSDRGNGRLDPMMERTLEALSDQGYTLAGRALAQMPRTQQVEAARAEDAVRRFHGDAVLDHDQRSALYEITKSLGQDDASRARVAHVLTIFAAAGQSEDSFRTKFLIDAADRGALPAKVLADLLNDARLELAQKEIGFEGHETARVLAHALGAAPLADHPTVYALIDRLASEVPAYSDSLAEIYGVLARQKLDRPDMLAKVIQQTEALGNPVPAPASADAEAAPGLTIVVGGPVWAAALADFANRPLDARAHAALRRFASDPDVGERVRAALVKQIDAPKLACGASTCDGLPARSPHDSRKRLIDVSLTAQTLAWAPSEVFGASLTQLRALRARETEPEQRIALGRIISEAQSLRYNAVGEVSPP